MLFRLANLRPFILLLYTQLLTLAARLLQQAGMRGDFRQI